MNGTSIPVVYTYKGQYCLSSTTFDKDSVLWTLSEQSNCDKVQSHGTRAIPQLLLFHHPKRLLRPRSRVYICIFVCGMANLDGTGEPNKSGVKFSGLLHPIRLQDLAREWLREDTPNFDYGGFVVGDKVETAKLVCKSAGVLAGVPFFDAVLNALDCSVQWNAVEGDFLQPICFAATVIGRVRNILLGERVALNCLCRASGIATYARRLADLARECGWHGEIAGTRKTTPGFRMVEKYSLLVGGIATHRYDLSSMVMLKDNHVWSAGNVTQVNF